MEIEGLITLFRGKSKLNKKACRYYIGLHAFFTVFALRLVLEGISHLKSL